jgi:hypothetical protein
LLSVGQFNFVVFEVVFRKRDRKEPLDLTNLSLGQS